MSRTNGIYLVSEECCPSCTDCFIIGSIWFRKHGKSFTKWDPKRCSCSSFNMAKKTQCAPPLWNFSEVSSVLETPTVPYDDDDLIDGGDNHSMMMMMTILTITQ